MTLLDGGTRTGRAIPATAAPHLERVAEHAGALPAGDPATGNGSRHAGGAADLGTFTEQQRVTVRGGLPAYPF